MTGQTDAYRWIAVRDCQGFLWAMYAAYEGVAFASFEGRLSSLHLHEVPGARHCSAASAAAALERENDDPMSDCWIVPINEQTIGVLKKKLSPSGVLGKHGVIVHTKLATKDGLIFSACDNFHKECVGVAAVVPLSLLAQLHHTGVLKHI